VSVASTVVIRFLKRTLKPLGHLERADDFDLLKLSAALALMIAALVLFLSMRIHRKE
jgi:hypothetical protein